MGYRKVLLPVSGKYRLERAMRALEHALNIVSPDGEICFLHCLEEVPHLIKGADHKKLVMEDTREAEALLKPLVDRSRHAGIGCKVRIVEASAVPAIHKTAAEEKSDVVVMFSDGRNELGKLFFGSITERVLQQLAVPLLVVH